MVRKGKSNERKSSKLTDKEKDANKNLSNVSVSKGEDVVFNQDPVIGSSSSSGNQEEDVDKTPSANDDGETPKRAKIAEPEEDTTDEEEEEEDELLSLTSGDERDWKRYSSIPKGVSAFTGSDDAEEPKGVNSTPRLENEGRKPVAKAKSVKKVAKSGTSSSAAWIPNRKRPLKIQVPAATPQRRSGRKVDDLTLRKDPTVWSKIEPNAKVFARCWNATFYSGTVDRKAVGNEVEEGEDSWIIKFDDGETGAISSLHILPMRIIGEGTDVTFLAGERRINGTVLGQQFNADGASECYALRLDGKDQPMCASRRDICFNEDKANVFKQSKEYKLAVQEKSDDEDGVDGDDEDDEDEANDSY